MWIEPSRFSRASAPSGANRNNCSVVSAKTSRASALWLLPMLNAMATIPTRQSARPSHRHSLTLIETRKLSMKSSTKERAKGRAREVKGTLKEAAGRAVGNPKLRDRGMAEKLGGKVQRKVGEV